jgi:hypothetical protein
MDLYEKSVMYYLVANGETFVAPHINLGKGLDRPDFIAIRPSKKEAYVVVIADAHHPERLIQRVEKSELEGLDVLRDHLERRRIADADWSCKVLLFVENESLTWFRKNIIDRENVIILSIDKAVESWRWNKQVWTSYFSFENEALKLSTH